MMRVRRRKTETTVERERGGIGMKDEKRVEHTSRDVLPVWRDSSEAFPVVRVSSKQRININKAFAKVSQMKVKSLPFPRTLFDDSHRSHPYFLPHDLPQSTLHIPPKLVYEPLQTQSFHSVIQTIDRVLPMPLYCFQTLLG